KAGWGTSSDYLDKDVTPADVMREFVKVKQTLQQFAVKHQVLLRVGELCRLYQRKWQMSGSLTALDSSELTQALDALASRHLVLGEGDGSMSVHPAVRDYFGQLAAASERGVWHHLIGQQFLSLAQQPGLRLPTDPASLDLLEEAIAHAVEANQPEKAW